MKVKVRDLEIGDCFRAENDKYGYRLTSFRWKPKDGIVLLSPSDSVAVPKELANFASGCGVCGISVDMDEEVEFLGHAPTELAERDMKSYQSAIRRDANLAAFSMKADKDGLTENEWLERWLLGE